jgi:hypothetical protein
MELSAKQNGLVSLTKAKVKRNGLIIEPGLDRKQWIDGVVKPLSELIHTMQQSARWWWGDALAYGEQNYGDIANMADQFGKDYDSMAACKYVSQRLPITRRRVELSWSHHAEVAMAIDDPNVMDQWLERAAKDGMSKSQLRKAIRMSKAEYNDPANNLGDQFAPIKSAEDLDMYFQHEDVATWDDDRCISWLNRLHRTAEAYHIMRSRFITG